MRTAKLLLGNWAVKMRPAIVGWPFVFKGRQMNSRIPFKRKNEAMRRIEAARRRMAALVGRTDLGTEDPLMAEIQMAQLDALLGIGYSMAGIEARIEVKLDDKYDKLVDGHMMILHRHMYELRLEIEELRIFVAKLNKVETPPSPPEDRPWWRRWE